MNLRHILMALIGAGLGIVTGLLLLNTQPKPTSAQQQIVTIETVAPDGQPSTVKGIIGGEPITLTDQGGATWTLHVTGVETK